MHGWQAVLGFKSQCLEGQALGKGKGIEARSGSHLTSMSFFSSASNSFSDKWARR